MPSGLIGLCLRLAYALHNSHRYSLAKIFFSNLMENDKFRPKKIVDAAMIFLVVTTVAIYLFSIGRQEAQILNIYENFAIAVFSIEYIIRLWTGGGTHKHVIREYEESLELHIPFSLRRVFVEIIKEKIGFMLKPMSIIDLLSIHPELRPLRLFKIFCYSQSARELFRILEYKKYELTVLAIIISVTIFIASALFYVFEIENKHLHSYFDSIYWAVITIATVGYGDIVPTSTEGKLASIFLVFSGLGVIAMLTSIFTTAFQQRITVARERKDFDLIHQLDGFVAIAGFGTMGRDISRRLAEAKIPFLVMDQDHEKIDMAKELGYHSFFADASNAEALHAVGLRHRARAILCLTRSDMTNVSIVLAARSVSPTIEIIAKANDVKNEQKLLLAKANHVISHRLGAQVLAEFINKPIAYEALAELIVDDKRVAADEIEVPKLNRADRTLQIESLQIEKFGCLLLGVLQRGAQEKFYFNNEAKNIRLKTGDIIVIIGKPIRIQGLRLLLEKEALDG